MNLQGPHWDFATGFYARAEVSEACLLLQDEAGVDVVVLLFALYCAQELSVLLRDEEIAAADALVAPWRAAAVWPLRDLRRQMKSAQTGAPADAAEGVRKLVKAAELRAEQVALGMLAQWERDRSRGGGDAPGAAAIGTLVRRVALFYAAQSAAGIGVLEREDVAQALGTLG